MDSNMKILKVLVILALAVSVFLCSKGFAQQQTGLDWSKFDFVSGDEIIFEDNQEGERNGEFPSRWDLVNGSVENAVFNGENVIMFINTNSNSTGGIVPMMTNGYEDYLPDEFTVEFDAYFDNHNRTYRVLFYDGKNQSSLNRSANPGSNNRVDRIKITQNSVNYGTTTAHYPGFGQSSREDAARSQPGWRRVSISFNKRALKVYLDDARVLNIPNMSYNPLGLTFAYHNPTGGHLGYMKNIRVGKGAVPLYDKVFTDGKIIATGIRFDVNKATLRPESYGVINEIVKLMKENSSLNFSVEGHTDSDGSESHNQTLSEARAKTVMEEMIKMGVSPSRLVSVGHGQSKPITGNDTAEGKAQNRRVEFVKF
jgi:outer membrane protein OmpA-like peptidoglycan-associated protein